jgi:hypothetical protein
MYNDFLSGKEILLVRDRPSAFRMAFSTYIDYISIPVGRLMALLNMSVVNNAVLMQSQFGLTGVELDRGLWRPSDIRRSTEAYQILKLSYER